MSELLLRLFVPEGGADDPKVRTRCGLLSGITGIMFAGWATDKFLKGKSHQSCMFCMIGAAIMVAIFWFLPAGMPSWIYSFALCGAGFCIYGPQGLVGVAAANLATKKAAGTANGLKGMFGYMSTLISGVGFGYVAQHFGWNAVYMVMIGMAIVGMCIFIYMWNQLIIQEIKKQIL